MKVRSQEIKREYIFTQKELKKKLKIKGDIQNIILFSGLSPMEESINTSKDKCEFVIETVEEEQND